MRQFDSSSQNLVQLSALTHRVTLLHNETLGTVGSIPNKDSFIRYPIHNNKTARVRL